MFLSQVRQCLGGELPKNTRDLKRVDALAWANLYASLEAIRDQRDVAFTCKLLLELGHRRFATAANLIAIRIREILVASRDGSSWETAGVLSFLPSSHGGHTVILDGASVA